MMDGLSHRVSPVTVSFSFATAPMSPALRSVTGSMVLPFETADMRQAFGGAAAGVDEIGVVMNDARDHLEVGDAAGERIGDGLEDECRSGAVVLDGALNFTAAVHGSRDGLVLGGSRKILDDEIHQQIRTDVVQGGTAQHGINAALANGLAQTLDDVLHRKSSFFEELFQQRIVTFGNHFD